MVFEGLIVAGRKVAATAVISFFTHKFHLLFLFDFRSFLIQSSQLLQPHEQPDSASSRSS